MDRRPSQPLTPAQAKARLRLAACRASPAGWLRRHPLTTAAAAAALGFIVGRDPRLAASVVGMLAPELARRIAPRRPH